MGKALTKEDLIYILQSVMRIADLENNALVRKADGLYVQGYREDLEQHTNDDAIHITQNLKDVISKLSVSANDELLYNGHPVVKLVSQAEGNMLSLNEDGLYVPTIDAKTHIENGDIHVTAEDKSKWNKTESALREFVSEELEALNQSLQVVQILFVSSLPEAANGAPAEKTLYFVADDPDRINECTYTIYLYRDEAWHVLGVTQKTLKNYVTTEGLKEELKHYEHSNQDTLDKFSEDENGMLLYQKKPALEMGVSDDDFNAIEIRDGKLYARSYVQEINSLMISSNFAKTNLYSQEINDVGTYILKDTIDNYTFLLIEYFHEKDDSIEIGGCVKTAIVDTDTLREIYDEGKTYMLEYGYGALTAHIQFSAHDNKLHVGYRRKVSIYKITGVRGGEIEPSPSIINIQEVDS